MKMGFKMKKYDEIRRIVNNVAEDYRVVLFKLAFEFRIQLLGLKYKQRDKYASALKSILKEEVNSLNKKIYKKCKPISVREIFNLLTQIALATADAVIKMKDDEVFNVFNSIIDTHIQSIPYYQPKIKPVLAILEGYKKKSATLLAEEPVHKERFDKTWSSFIKLTEEKKSLLEWCFNPEYLSSTGKNLGYMVLLLLAIRLFLFQSIFTKDDTTTHRVIIIGLGLLLVLGHLYRWIEPAFSLKTNSVTTNKLNDIISNNIENLFIRYENQQKFYNYPAIQAPNTTFFRSESKHCVDIEKSEKPRVIKRKHQLTPKVDGSNIPKPKPVKDKLLQFFKHSEDVALNLWADPDKVSAIIPKEYLAKVGGKNQTAIHTQRLLRPKSTGCSGLKRDLYKKNGVFYEFKIKTLDDSRIYCNSYLRADGRIEVVPEYFDPKSHK